MKAALTTLLITAIVAAYGQALDDSDLSKLAGEWTGSLTYTDYSDDKSKVTLSTDLTIVDKNGKLKFRYVYTEPGGGEEVRSGSMSLNQKSNKLDFGSSWKIESYEEKEDGWQMELSMRGKDNNKSSTMRMDIEYSGSSLVYIKKVKYDSESEFFERNRHEFQRQ